MEYYAEYSKPKNFHQILPKTTHDTKKTHENSRKSCSWKLRSGEDISAVAGSPRKIDQQQGKVRRCVFRRIRDVDVSVEQKLNTSRGDRRKSHGPRSEEMGDVMRKEAVIFYAARPVRQNR